MVFMTEGYRITGVLSMPGDGYGNRMTDYLNATERHFIALTDVEIERVGSDCLPTRRDFLALSRRHVVVAIPEEKPPPSAPETA